MSLKPYPAIAWFLLAVPLTGLAQASLDSFGVSKKLDYLQSSAASPVSQTILGDPNGPFHFSADITGSSLNLFSPVPKVALPSSTQYNLAGNSTMMGLSTSHVSKSSLDGAYPNGTYNFLINGVTLPSALGATDTYSSEIPQITNGTWDGVGKLVISASSGATLNFNTFSNYGSGVGGIIYFRLYAVTGGVPGAELASVQNLALSGYASDPALTSYTVAPGFLQADRTYYAELSYARIVHLNVSFLPVVGLATYMRTTGFLITTATPAVAPGITTQPVGQTVTAGGSALISVVATGNPAPAYQWRKDGVAIVGAILASYSLGNVQSADAGSYSVVVSNAAGQVTSGAAVLTVTAPATLPAISTQPGSQTVAEGSSVAFSVGASGSPTPTYQWKKNGTTISGATGSTLALSGVTLADGGAYAVDVSNPAGTVTSTAATLTVTTIVPVAPVFSVAPRTQTVGIGADVTFTVEVVASPAPTFQWQKDEADIAGATAQGLTLTRVTTGAGGRYRVIATNAAGAVVSASATLIVVGAAVSSSGDFNADGKADIIWSNSLTGERAIWLMNGTLFLASSTLGVFPLEWTVAATGDFNGDGKTDIVWSNSLTGERALWLMDGTMFLASSTLGVFPFEWTVAATGDFNADGKPDIIWSNSVTGERAIWLMNGTMFLASSTLGVFPLEWTVVGTGDFNADGKPDIVWSNSLTGERAIWLMNGTMFLGSSTLGIFPLEWAVVGTGDFNADGKPDIIWSNSATGERALWLMDGTMFLGSSTLGIFPLEWIL